MIHAEPSAPVAPVGPCGPVSPWSPFGPVTDMAIHAWPPGRVPVPQNTIAWPNRAGLSAVLMSSHASPGFIW